MRRKRSWLIVDFVVSYYHKATIDFVDIAGDQ